MGSLENKLAELNSIYKYRFVNKYGYNSHIFEIETENYIVGLYFNDDIIHFKYVQKYPNGCNHVIILKGNLFKEDIQNIFLHIQTLDYFEFTELTNIQNSFEAIEKFELDTTNVLKLMCNMFLNNVNN